MKKGEEGGETPPHTLSLDRRPLLEQCPREDEDWVDVRCPGDVVSIACAVWSASLLPLPRRS